MVNTKMVIKQSGCNEDRIKFELERVALFHCEIHLV